MCDRERESRPDVGWLSDVSMVIKQDVVSDLLAKTSMGITDVFTWKPPTVCERLFWSPLSDQFFVTATLYVPRKEKAANN